MGKQLDILILNGMVVAGDQEGTRQADLAISREKIAAIASPGMLDRATAGQIINAEGCWVLPGGVDVHAHIEQMSGMGQMNADTFETATRSAAMGGTTSVISFAAQASGEKLMDTVANYSSLARRGGLIDHAFHITITDPEVVNFETDLEGLIKQGHRSLKVFTTYNIQLSDAQILHVMTQARRHGALVCVHAENDAIIARAKAELISAGKLAPKYHAQSHPRMAEIEAIERMCRFAEFLDQPVMIFHISTAEGVDIVRTAKKRGAPVWAETCTHYLIMAEDILDKPGLLGAKWMCSPPQRQIADQEALWAGLDDGIIDLVSSDHAPYRFDSSGKLSAGPNPGFHQIANGLPGLETRLPMLFNEMVSKGRMGLEAFAQVTSSRPAQIYGLTEKGSIEVGKHADITLWDPHLEHTYGEDDLHDNVGYNPWAGHSVKGWPVHVLQRGKSIMNGGVLAGKPGEGKWIDRPELATRPTGKPAGDSWI